MTLKSSHRRVLLLFLHCYFAFGLFSQKTIPIPTSGNKSLFCDLLLDLGPDVLLCRDSSVTFQAAAGFATYLWQDGSTSIAFTAAAPGTYWLEVTDTCGNTQVDSIRLSFRLIEESRQPDAVICPEEWVTPAIPGFDTYAWSPPAGLSCTSCPAPQIQPAATTQYTLFATNSLGCVLRDTFTVAVQPLPTRTDTIRFCPGDTVLIGSTIYTEPGTVIFKVKIPGVCDTIVTKVLLHKPVPTRNQTVFLSSGQSVVIEGVAYSQPDTVTVVKPAPAGSCDSVIVYVIELDPVVPDTCTTSDFFQKQYSITGSVAWGYALCPSADGSLYVAGIKSFPDALLMKVSPAGEVLWSRSLPVLPLEWFHIVELIEDSEGMLVICGNFSEGDIAKKAGVLRYDPAADKVLWLKILEKEQPTVFGVRELTPGGNFLLNLSTQLTAGVTDIQLWELERNTGNLPGNTAKRYSLGTSDAFSAIEIKNGFLYAAGQLSIGQTSPVQIRHALSKIDLASGVPVWTQLSQTDVNSQVSFSNGADLVIDGNAIVSVYRGVDSNSVNAPLIFFMQKTDLDGHLLWNKRYLLPYGEAKEIVAVPDGYIVYGISPQNSKWPVFILKTDKNGTPIWAHRLERTIWVNTSYNSSHQSEIVVQGGKVFVVAAEENYGGAVLLKLDPEDGSTGTCEWVQPFNLPYESISNPAQAPVNLLFTNHFGQSRDTLAATFPVAVSEKTYCVECTPPCTPVVNSFSQTFCLGDTVFVAGMAFTEPGTYSDTLTASAPGGCDTIRLYTFLLRNTKTVRLEIYTGESVVIDGVAYSQAGTVLDTVPSAGGGCDSLITYHIRVLLRDTCTETNTFVKVLGEYDAGKSAGYNLCAASDGNFYVAGIQKSYCVMAKISPSGKVLWARKFDFNFSYPLHIMELIEDSEGMLVAAGHVELGGSQPKAMAFRYDPNGDKFLWTQVIRYPPGQLAELRGVTERSPGGNFLLLSRQGELLELTRSTGTPTGPAIPVYLENGDVANGQSTMVRRGNALYCAGGYFNGTPNALSKHRLSKIDLASGQLVWTRLGPTSPGASGFFTSADLIADSSSLVSLYEGAGGAFSGAYTGFFLQKSTLDGEPLWLKSYKISVASSSVEYYSPEEVIAVPDGYVVQGQVFRDSSYHIFVLKTDKNGQPLWARLLKNSTLSTGDVLDYGQNTVLASGDVLFTVGSTFNVDTSLNGVFLLAKFNADGTLDSPCDMAPPVTFAVEDVPNPVSTSIALQPHSVTRSITPNTVAASPNSLRERVLCFSCKPVPCEPVSLRDSTWFCPGDTVYLDGVTYTQPTTILDTLPGVPPGVCDTLLSHVLLYEPLPQPSNPAIFCPANLTVTVPAQASGATVSYAAVNATTDCLCGEISRTLEQGLSSSALFPVGQTAVCYRALDACGSSRTCCFTVSVVQEPDQGEACDTKNTPCVRFELLGIFQNAAKQKTYRMRVTNLCGDPLEYVLFQLPDGIVADQPAQGASYTTAGGRSYSVRNPNFAPFYGIRFRTAGAAGISAGQSDVFEYTLPPQAYPLYIHAAVRFASKTFVETHLNVFACEVQSQPKNAHGTEEPESATRAETLPALRPYPNPARHLLVVDLLGWPAQPLTLRVRDAFGRVLLERGVQGGEPGTVLTLKPEWPAGVYWLEVAAPDGRRQVARFVREGF